MNLKKGLVLLTLALLIIPSASMLAFSDSTPNNNEDDCELASDILSLVETSRDKAEAIFSSLEADGIEIPEEAENAFEKGNESLEEALIMLDEGDCTSAAEKLMEALQHFGKSAQKALKAKMEPEDEEAENEIGLREAIERAYMFLEKVNDTATDFEDRGLNVTDVRDMLLDANQTLTQAETELDAGNFTGAAELKAAARSTLGRAMGKLRSLNKGNKAVKAAKFLEKTEDRLDKLQEKLNDILGGLDLPPQAAQGINRALMNAQNRIQVIKDLLNSGNLENAIDELDEVLEGSDKALDIVDEHDHGLGNKLRALERIQAKLDILNETVQTLKDEGEDVSSLESILDEAQIKLNEASDILTTPDLNETQLDEAESLIDEAEELVEEVDDLLDEVKEDVEQREDLDELLEKIQELYDVAEELASEGENMTDVKSLLEEAEDILNGINVEDEEEYVEEQIEEAEELIDEAEEILEDLLESEEEDGSEDEISERIEELEEELSSLEEEITELEENNVNVNPLKGQMEALRNLIEQAKVSVNPMELIEEAENLIEEIEHNIEELD